MTAPTHDPTQSQPAENLGNIVDVGITRFAFDLKDDASAKASTVGWAYRSAPDRTGSSVEYLLLFTSELGQSFPNLAPQLFSDGGAEQKVQQQLFKKDGVDQYANLDAFIEFVKFMGVKKADVQLLVAGMVTSVASPAEWPEALPDTGKQPFADVDGIGGRGPGQIWFFSTASLPFAHGEFSAIRQVYGVFPDLWEMAEKDIVTYRKLDTKEGDGAIADVTNLAGFVAATEARIAADPGKKLVLRYGSYFTFADPQAFWG